MVVEIAVSENILHQLGDKQTVACSTLAKQHKVLFLIGLLAIPKQPLNLTQKLKIIRIVISSATSMVEKTLQLKQLRHRALAINCFLLLGFYNP
jgi:hypothetical protein